MVAGQSSDIRTIIERDAANNWKVTYVSSSLIEKLVFNSSPDDSRIRRWKPLDDNISISMVDGVETIQHLNAERFKNASFSLTPTYVSLPKEYAPFSPFSDGGMVLYSGRFFVCPDRCVSTGLSFKFQLVSEKQDNIIVNGQVRKGKASWIDQMEGQKVYVGSAVPIESDDIYAIVDKGLPESLINALNQQIPSLMSSFAERFGKPKTKPTLFVSHHSEAHEGGYGSQGGVLPNQVFMHWYGEDSVKSINTYRTNWFITHEIAHLYQGKGFTPTQNKDHWLSEGHAEYMAYLSLYNAGDMSRQYADETFEKNKQKCIEASVEESFGERIGRGEYRVLYQCGMLIWQSLDSELKRLSSTKTVDDLWTLYQEVVTKTGDASIESFLEAVRPFVSDSTYQSIEKIQAAKSRDFEMLLVRER